MLEIRIGERLTLKIDLMLCGMSIGVLIVLLVTAIASNRTEQIPDLLSLFVVGTLIGLIARSLAKD